MRCTDRRTDGAVCTDSLSADRQCSMHRQTQMDAQPLQHVELTGVDVGALGGMLGHVGHLCVVPVAVERAVPLRAL